MDLYRNPGHERERGPGENSQPKNIMTGENSFMRKGSLN